MECFECILLPVWWNGRRGRLKIYSGQPGAGSSPAIGNSPDKLSSKRMCPVFSFIATPIRLNSYILSSLENS